MFNDLSMRIFLGHLVAYVAVTAISAGVNLWLTPDTLWFPWVLIGWGVAVATHAFALLLRKTRRRERIFIDRKARAFAVHLFAYVAVVLVLLFVNITVTPKVWWFYWVALGWGAGVASGLVHLLQEAQTGARRYRPSVTTGRDKSRPEQQNPPKKRASRKKNRRPELSSALGDQRIGRKARIEQAGRLLGAGHRQLRLIRAVRSARARTPGPNRYAR